MISLYDVIKKPLVTEKSSAQKESQKIYVFHVDLRATKPLIKKSVEKLFGVKVRGVRTSIVPGKVKRFGQSFGKTNHWKRAVVQLSEGQIQLFEGV